MIDWIAMLFNIAGTLTNAHKNKLCWPLWVAGNTLWMVWGSWTHNWAVVCMNGIFLVLNLYA